MIIRLITCMLLIFTNLNSYAQDTNPNVNKNPVKAMFVQRYLHVNNWVRLLNYGASNKVLRRYKTYVSPRDKKGWQLTFNDDFDSIDINKWRLGQPWGYYHDASLHQHHSVKQVWADSGYLHLGGAYEPKAFVHKDSNIIIPYGIGLINSDISFMQKYGYFEIRCKNPEGPATWPAFWLTGAHRWPPEIDIFEMYGKKNGARIHKQISSIHYGVSETKSRGTLVRQIRLTKDTDKEFHVYGCKWSPYYIRFYTDGVLVKKQRVNKRLRKFMDDEMVIIINNGFEAKYLKYLPKDFKGNVFTVDWVRAYKKIN
jgi:beta-glucanase (GH16 family)